MTTRMLHAFHRRVGGRAGIPVSLGLGDIYIVPTGYGALYLGVLAAMLIGSINYNNNLGFLLTFLLGSLGLTAMLHTYGILDGLRLRTATATPVFAGENLAVEIAVGGIDRPRMQVRWFFEAGPQTVTNLKPGERVTVSVAVPAQRRGIARPGRLRIVSDFPLGLFRAWARVDTGVRALVYPQPVAGPLSVADTPSHRGTGAMAQHAGVDDFAGLSAYRPGDPLHRVHWQAYSRGRGLHTKTFCGSAGGERMLDMDRVDADNVEEKLSILCYQVCRAHRQRLRYGLMLGGTTIPVGSGGGHRHRCLRALALFGQGGRRDA